MTGAISAYDRALALSPNDLTLCVERADYLFGSAAAVSAGAVGAAYGDCLVRIARAIHKRHRNSERAARAVRTLVPVTMQLTELVATAQTKT